MGIRPRGQSGGGRVVVVVVVCVCGGGERAKSGLSSSSCNYSLSTHCNDHFP